MRNKPLPQEIYKHFKGNQYQVKCIAKHSETGEEMVVYQALYGKFEYYTRPLQMFMEEVDHVKYPNVVQKYRFEKVSFEEDLAASNDTEKSDEMSDKSTSADIAEVTETTDTAEMTLDPKIYEFLDARTYEEKLGVLYSIRDRLTDDMIDIMSAATDIQVKSGSVEERYEEFKRCLITMQHFECDRLH